MVWKVLEAEDKTRWGKNIIEQGMTVKCLQQQPTFKAPLTYIGSSYLILQAFENSQKQRNIDFLQIIICKKATNPLCSDYHHVGEYELRIPMMYGIPPSQG